LYKFYFISLLAKTSEEIKETLLLSDKGIEELIHKTTQAWLPILLIDNFFLLLKKLWFNKYFELILFNF
jgi:hypothetical protein